MPNALPALGNCSIWQVPRQIYREAQNENKYKNKRHKTLSNFTTVQNFLLHRVTNFQVRKRKLLNMQSMQQASKATKSPRGKKCLQFYTNSIFTVQSCGDKRKTNVRSRNCRHGKDTYLKCLKEVASKWKLFQLWITLKMKHILSFLWSHCLNKKVILNCLGNSRGLREAAFGQRACYDNEYPAITTKTTPTTTSLRWGRHGTFAFGRCRFGHLHMTASRRGRGPHKQLWRWRVGATTFRGTQRCCKCSSRSSTASAVSQFVRTSRLTRGSTSRSWARRDYQRLQSRTVPSPVEKLRSLTNCSPLPSPIPLSECCMNFLSHAIAANKHRLVSGGRHSADQRYKIAKCETCQ